MHRFPKTPQQLQASMLKHLRFELSLAFLVVLTLVALFGEEQILGRNIVLDKNSIPTAYTYSDGDTSGGNSESRMENDKILRWSCILRDQNAFPYCSLGLGLGLGLQLPSQPPIGLNLKNYTKVRFWLNYSGPAKTLRIYLRNYDPRYSTPDGDKSTKYNQVEFNVNLLSDYVEFSLMDFFVANWWLREFDIPPQLSHPQFDNIVGIDIQTGSGVYLGQHQFQLQRIEFVGRLMSTSDWYLGIILVWVAFILSYLMFRVIGLHRALRQQRQRERELLEANALLDKHLHQLEHTAKTDFLTGTFNRFGIEEALSNCLKDWRHNKSPFAIILMDIDYFKRINDSLGHDAGDRVLSSLAHLLQTQIRQEDLLARWGGEEFLLVCRNTSLDGAVLLAEKLRQSVENNDGAIETSVTASFGVASINQCLKLDKLFKAADTALYSAKAAGRNRVVAATNSGEDYPSK